MPSYSEEMVKGLDTELQTYKSRLEAMYNQKIDLISHREALRFRYLSAFRKKFEQQLSLISTDIFNLGDEAASNMWNAFIKAVRQSVRMKNFDGSTLGNPDNADRFGTDVIFNIPVDGRENISFLSPLSLFITSKPKLGNNFVQPYKFFATQIRDFEISNILKVGYTSEPPWGNIFLKNQTYKKYPWTVNDIINSIYVAQVIGSRAESTALPTAQKIFIFLNKDYGQGTLTQIMDEGFGLYMDVNRTTLQILRLQLDIDDYEVVISKYLTEFKASGEITVLSASQIYNELSETAKAANALAVKAMSKTPNVLPVGAKIVGEPNQLLNAQIQASQAPQGTDSNKKLMIAIAAGVAAFSVFGKGQS